MSSRKPAFLLIHGSWHNHATWDRIRPFLEAAGFRTRALDLPGAGAHAKSPRSFFERPLDSAAFAAEPSPNAGVTQAQRTAAVIAAIDELGGEAIVVGHSLGGLTVSCVAEAAPEKCRAAVYLTAFMLPPGAPRIAFSRHESMAGALTATLLLADRVEVGASRLDPRSSEPAYVAALKETFYGDVSDADFTAIAAGLHCDEPASVLFEPSPVTARRFGRLPRFYIRCLRDRAIPISGQDYMIAAVDAALGGATRVLTLDASHSPFLSQPEALAEILIGIGADL